ncbi:hypothetical protein [Yoonia sp. R2-816]|uniref:hypothetical protein n=1 Tax=Yoonia sp. R2-816 TaxID=3342638 RepID=UPI0037292E6B
MTDDALPERDYPDKPEDVVLIEISENGETEVRAFKYYAWCTVEAKLIGAMSADMQLVRGYAQQHFNATAHNTVVKSTLNG